MKTWKTAQISVLRASSVRQTWVVTSCVTSGKFLHLWALLSSSKNVNNTIYPPRTTVRIKLGNIGEHFGTEENRITIFNISEILLPKLKQNGINLERILSNSY